MIRKALEEKKTVYQLNVKTFPGQELSYLSFDEILRDGVDKFIKLQKQLSMEIVTVFENQRGKMSKSSYVKVLADTRYINKDNILSIEVIEGDSKLYQDVKDMFDKYMAKESGIELVQNNKKIELVTG